MPVSVYGSQHLLSHYVPKLPGDPPPYFTVSRSNLGTNVIRFRSISITHPWPRAKYLTSDKQIYLRRSLWLIQLYFRSPLLVVAFYLRFKWVNMLNYGFIPNPVYIRDGKFSCRHRKILVYIHFLTSILR